MSFTCATCKKVFSCQSSLSRHIKQVHDKIKNHKCPQCEWKFSTKSDVNRHVKQVHDNKKDHKCSRSGCNAEFTVKSDLTNHIKFKHNNIRNFKCEYPNCGEKFHDAGKLRRHEKIHTDEKNYHCEYDGCNMGFKLKENLDRHVKDVHLNIRNHPCPNEKCDYKCRNSSDLKKHTAVCTNGIIGSFGEVTIKKILESMGIEYIYDSSYQLTGKSGKHLRWDFRIDTDDDPIFIEYDGIQHFVAQRFGSRTQTQAEEALKLQQEKDKLKDNFCKDNGYLLLRISYKQKNIEELVKNFINEHFDLV